MTNLFYNRDGSLSTLKEWVEDFGAEDRTVAVETVEHEEYGDLVVSTIFMGIDHNWMPEGPPHIFETMVFDEKGHNPRGEMYCQRYSTEEEAILGHEVICSRIINGTLELYDTGNEEEDHRPSRREKAANFCRKVLTVLRLR